VSFASTEYLAMRTRVGAVLNRWPTAGLAAGVVRDGSLTWFHGHGVADIGARAPVDEDTVFRIASITKTFTRDRCPRVRQHRRVRRAESNARQGCGRRGDREPDQRRDPGRAALPGRDRIFYRWHRRAD
jgi:Beta-lactamase